MEWILGIVSALLGGLNIFQLLTFRAYKRQRNAEADTAEIESLSKIITQNQAEIGRLSQRLNEADKRALEQDRRYEELMKKYDDLRNEFFDYKLTHK
jgi:predicted RNase H-like nuclease (RuvC/YqgF family)